MEVISVEKMQKLDRLAIETYGIPSTALMENAGCAVAREVLLSLKRKRSPKVSIFCGLGNNAGDGFVTARHLINADVKTFVFLVGKAGRLKGDALINYCILRKCGIAIKEIYSVTDSMKERIQQSDMLVDAIFGTGLSRQIEEPFRSVIELMNASLKRIVAIDVPSGLDGTTGKIYGVCIKADKTVTLACPKAGFYRKSGPRMAGKIIVADIGIPKKLRVQV